MAWPNLRAVAGPTAHSTSRSTAACAMEERMSISAQRGCPGRFHAMEWFTGGPGDVRAVLHVTCAG